MPLLRRPATRPPRSALVVGLLLLTLALAGLLAHQAQDAARSHRTAAESALRDYAASAGEEYAARLKKILDDEIIHRALWAALTAEDTLTVPPSDLLHRTHVKGYHAEVPAESHFSLDLASGELRTLGETLPPGVRRWVADSLALDASDNPPNWAHASVLAGEGRGRRLLTYTVKARREGGPGVAYGFTLDPRLLSAPLHQAFYRPLLPKALAKGLPNDSLLSVVVLAGGAPLFDSGHPYDRALGAETPLPEEFGPFTVRTSLRPEAAGMLVIGGLPRSRLPVLLGLLVLTAGLVIAAIYQLRREYELARLRAEFVSSVSHELRTPLAQIRMFGETLLLGRVRSDEERRRSLEIIDHEARRLSHLVENVLRFSRAERSRSRVDPCDVEAAPLVREVVEGFAPLAAANGVRVSVRVEDGVVARMDPEAVRQVLLNFLDNAVKYGPRGQTVEVSAERAGEWLRLRVDDEGPGVPARERERVWDAFWRLERESSSAVAGTGIGLAVVREIVDLHGGRARVETSPSGGARFVVELPGARSLPRERPAPAPLGEEVA